MDKLQEAVERLQKSVDKLQKGKGKGEKGDKGDKGDRDDVSNSAPARITVHLPADAKLYVDNVPCTLTSAKRTFATPQLEPGVKYSYTLRVEMTQNGESISKSRQVTMQAGQHVEVNFNAAQGVFTVNAE